MIILKTRSEVKIKVTVTRKWYATLRHHKMYPLTKFGIPISKNMGDKDRTRKPDGRTDSAITICLPKFLWGLKIAGKVVNLFLPIIFSIYVLGAQKNHLIHDCDSSFEYTQHMFLLRNKKCFFSYTLFRLVSF